MATLKLSRSRLQQYKVDVTYAGKRIPYAPFLPKIEPGKPSKDISGVKVFGPGVAKEGNEWHFAWNEYIPNMQTVWRSCLSLVR